MLESFLWEDNSMVTLTYDDAHLPRLEDGRGFLTRGPKSDLTLWLKRFRKSLEPVRVRFYAAGEYGDENWRPHFHVVLFNYPNCRFGQSRYTPLRRDGSRLVSNCCDRCDRIRDTWGKGDIKLIELNDHTAQYSCGYVTKKMTNKDHPALKGLPPEYAVMSRRPGLGVDFMWDVASTFMEFNLEKRQIDVPSILQYGSRHLPLGRFLTRRLRVLCGRDEKAPVEVLEKIKEELSALRESAFDRSVSFAEEIVKENTQAVLNMEARFKINDRGRKL